MLRRELACEVDLVRRGVDRERFRPAERGKTWPTPLRILTVGRMFYGKGHHLALEAAGGLLVNPGSALELAEAVVQLLRTSTPRRAADAALTRAAELREDVMLDDYERVTRAAIG